MTIYLSSRYQTSVVDYLAFTPVGIGVPTVFYTFSDIGTLSYTEYTWKDGDRLDQVSAQFFKYPTMWWRIAEANPKIVDIHDIPAGTVVKIPHV